MRAIEAKALSDTIGETFKRRSALALDRWQVIQDWVAAQPEWPPQSPNGRREERLSAPIVDLDLLLAVLLAERRVQSSSTAFWIRTTLES
ncbi:MAG TPA: hypothetical protein VFA26_05210 [Gemmataceae bacterium]|nr:hypothetical protein [Gemmataceae bacterium]